jgi:hypothetical protein|nr:MAG TPA: hypothetical protein [Caudoviricetes sp.]
MKAELYYIQSIENGSVAWEAWTAAEPVSNQYVNQDVLKTREVELPKGWSVGYTPNEVRGIFDNNNRAVKIKGGYNSAIYALSGESEERIYLRKAK